MSKVNKMKSTMPVEDNVHNTILDIKNTLKPNITLTLNDIEKDVEKDLQAVLSLEITFSYVRHNEENSSFLKLEERIITSNYYLKLWVDIYW